MAGPVEDPKIYFGDKLTALAWCNPGAIAVSVSGLWEPYVSLSLA